MANRCQLTGKTVQMGNRVSHSKRRTRHAFLPNLHKKRFWSANLKRFVTLKVSASTIRSIDKVGLDSFADRNGISLKKFC